MTDRIDIDDLDVGEKREERPNRGDWFWAGEGDPDEETGWRSDADDDGTDVVAGGDDAGNPDVDAAADDAESGDTTGGGAPTNGVEPTATPGVPLTDDEAPVGIPVYSGGAGAGDGGAQAGDGGAQAGDGGAQAGDEGSPEDDDPAANAESATPREPTAGGTAHETHADPDGMTTAFTYGAIRRLANPRRAVGEARGWSDWVGVVGDVDAHVLNKFQREHRLDLDFFNGTGTGPAERLAAVDEHSMFYADRMVVVGVDGDAWIAETADWEFVHLEEAASEAGWDRRET